MPFPVKSTDVPSTANVLTGQFERQIGQPVFLTDSTLREGEQTPGVKFGLKEKLEIAAGLSEFGMHFVSVGFPAVSKEEREICARIVRGGFKFKTAAMARATAADVDIAIDVGVDNLRLFLATSDGHLQSKLGITESEALSRIEKAARHCRDRGVAFAFSAEDASRTPLARLVKVYQLASDLGAEFVTFSDTVGILTPHTTYRIIQILRSLVKAPIGLHCHNDLGLALANSLAGLEAGAQIVSGTVNGIGERAGNVCSEEAAVALKVKYGRDLGLNLAAIPALCDTVHRICGTTPPGNKAITGKWSFTHESGIHVAGVLSNPDSYQPFPPQMIGRTHEIVFGKHSGRHAVNYVAGLHGVELSEAASSMVLTKIKERTEQDAPFTDDEIIALIKSAGSRSAP